MNRTVGKLSFGLKRFFLPKKVEPPYNHACQIGDPVLRQPAEIVEPELINTKEFQSFVKHMVKMMRLYDACGLSAPQLGISMQLFIVELSERLVRLSGPTIRKAHQLEPVPLKVFINPKMKIIDYGVIRLVEGCVSTVGYAAEVPRYKEVLITGLNAEGKTHEWHAKNWAARIAQHEMDHLKGVLFTDKMDQTTLAMSDWQGVNETGGKVKLTFEPGK